MSCSTWNIRSEQFQPSKGASQGFFPPMLASLRHARVDGPDRNVPRGTCPHDRAELPVRQHRSQLSRPLTGGWSSPRPRVVRRDLGSDVFHVER